MSKEQRVVLIIGCGLLALATLFPPYTIMYQGGTQYGFLLRPPTYTPLTGSMSFTEVLKFSQLFLEYVVIVAGTLLAFLVVAKQRKDAG